MNPRILFAVRLATSVCLALFITYWLELQNAFWAATTAAIVCQPNLGASLQKGRYRVLGTIIGALVMVALLSLFAQQRNTLILSLSIWCGLCGCAVVVLRNYASYAAGLAGITATIIFADSISDPTTAFFLAVTRVGEISIGIGSAALMMLVTENGAAGRQVSKSLEQTARQLWSGFLDTLAARQTVEAQTAIRHEIVRTLGLLRTQVDAAIGESSYLHSRRGNLNHMHRRLLEGLVGWRNIDHLVGSEISGLATVKRQAHDLFLELDPAAISKSPSDYVRKCNNALSELAAVETNRPEAKIVTQGAHDVLVCLEAIADCQALLGNEGALPRKQPMAAPVVVDPLPVLIAGLRVFAAVLLTAVFWIETAWSIGQFAVVFAAIATLVFASFGDQARALATQYSIGASCMAVVGGILYFGVFPSLSLFSQLLTVLAAFYLVVGFMQAGKSNSVFYLAMSVCSLPMLGIANPTLYNAANYFNLALAIVTGSIIGTCFFALFPTMDPALREWRLLDRSMDDLRRLLRNLRATPAARWTTLLSGRVSALPVSSSDARFSDLIAISAAGRSASQLIDGLARTPCRAALVDAFNNIAVGNVFSARDQLHRLVDLVRASDFPATDQLKTRMSAQIIVLTDILRDHSDLLGSARTRSLANS